MMNRGRLKVICGHLEISLTDDSLTFSSKFMERRIV